MGVMQALQTFGVRVVGSPVVEAEPQSAACLNCGTPLHGPFCSACGQRDIPPYPSVRELVVDAFWELSGWDGRFASTVRALVRRPGMLTREFLEGRRARYLSPLRLYLLASLLYFVVAGAAPDLKVERRATLGAMQVSVPTGVTGPSRPQRVAEAAGDALDGDGALNAATRARVLADVEHAPALMRPVLRRAIGDPTGFKRGLVETIPRMLFALLPVFAGIVALFYRGRRYPEHLYFAIHLHAFVFLALSVAKLTAFTRVLPLVMLAGATTVVWIPVYATLAFRRVYGGSITRTVAKELVIGVIYCAISAAAFVCTIYWVSVAR